MPAESQRTPLILSQVIQGIGSNPSPEVEKIEKRGV